MRTLVQIQLGPYDRQREAKSLFLIVRSTIQWLCNTGKIPKNQQWIEITIPAGTTYEVVTTYSLTNWNDANVSKEFGDLWLTEKRSCILYVPSIIAPVDNNILINEFHPQFLDLSIGLNQPVIWDKRLFFDTE